MLYMCFVIVITFLLQYEMQHNDDRICDRPRENRPSSHLGMIVEIPILKVVISITSFCSC